MATQRMRDRFAQLVSSDEAPDTGDDSDEDLITSYLGTASTVAGGSGDGLIPTIQVTPHSPNANRILEDNLLQLAQIQDRIQMLRMENAASGTTAPAVGELSLFGLSSTQAGERLSTSCPSLNNSTSESPFAADISQTPPSTTTDNSTPSHQDKNRNFTQNGNNEHYQRRRKNDPLSGVNAAYGLPSGGKNVHRKRQGRQRSLSVSSGDSDEDVGVDRVDGVGGTASNKIRQRSASNMGGSVTGRSTTVPIVVTSAVTSNDNRNNNHSTASSVYHRLIHGRPSQKSPHLLAQLPALHKSISTPSIVVEPSGSSTKSGQSTRRFPEPTHVFLQRLIADHDWAAGRRSGSETDSEDEALQQASSDFGQTGFANPNTAFAASQFGNNLVARKLVNNSTGSPQLSWAEFLVQDDPTLEDDDSRKRRRKKERSSIFFRKKKDKTTKPPPNTFFEGQPPYHPYHHHHTTHGVNAQGSAASKGLSKVSSSINLGNSGGSSGLASLGRASISGQPPSVVSTGRLTHYSHSLSSLRKPSISGPDIGSGFPPPFAAPTSNFYIARGETSSPRSRRRNAQSQWSKVGRKLGVIKTHLDDRDEYGHEDTVGLIEGEFIPSEEFPEGGPAAIRDLETPPFLRIQDDEPETWQQTVRQEDLKLLRPVDIKRQEHMYEFIITESNHCQVLKVIQKIFAEGMYKYLNLGKDIVERIFPCIDQLIDIHFRFLEKLRIRQNEQPVMSTLGDILLEQFSGESGDKWREAYGSFCAGHSDAVNVYKDLMKSDRRFGQFVRQCSENPLLKKKGVPECILFVTTRITKYPLLIEPLIKTSKEKPAEQEQLRQANTLVRDILRDINSKVAEKERKQRLLEIYHKVDPKSTIMYNGRKFKKSDILLDSRRLMFEGVGTLHQSRGRLIQVIIVVLSDIVLFLQENNQKYYFITPENKPSVVPVKTLIAKEKPGGSTKSLHLILTSEKEPEVFEMEIIQPPTREDWITGIREAVDACSPGSDSEDAGVGSEEEQRKRQVQSKYLRLRRLTAELRGKDIELAKLLEDKMRIMSEMLAVVGTPDPLKDRPPDYTTLVKQREESNDPSNVESRGSRSSVGGGNNYTKEQLLSAVQEASRLASSLYSSGSSLSRSVSSVGERHSAAYTSPILPKRAETFGGFDIQQKVVTAKEINIEDGREEEILVRQNTATGLSSAESVGILIETKPGWDEPEGMELSNVQAIIPTPKNLSIPPFLNLDSEQQQAAVQMTHYLNSLMCMVSEHFTSLESLKAELSEIKEKSTIMGGRYKHNQLLEDLRNLQESLAQEKKSWGQEKELMEQEMEAKKKELAKYQADIERGLKDVREQREQLYRKLDVLKGQGIELGPNMAVLKSDPLPQKSSMPNVDVIFYSEVSPNNEASASANNSNSLLMAASSSSGPANLRKSSSMSMSSGVVLPQASSVTQGGSLKKESLANLHLLSATNESKVSQEIKQQIPVKLSKLSVSTGATGGVKDKSKRSASSTSSLSLVGSGSKSTGTSGTIVNLAKPESVQQLLPFKLSESEAGIAAGISAGTVKSGKMSPKQQQQQRIHQFSSFPSSDSTHQRTGSSPTLLPIAGGIRAGNSNTLPKAGGNNGSKQVQKVPYTNSEDNSDDKVIYF